MRPPAADRVLGTGGGTTRIGAGARSSEEQADEEEAAAAAAAALVVEVVAVAAATLAGVRRTRISPRMSSRRDILWLIRCTSLRTSCLSSVNESMMDESDLGIWPSPAVGLYSADPDVLNAWPAFSRLRSIVGGSSTLSCRSGTRLSFGWTLLPEPADCARPPVVVADPLVSVVDFAAPTDPAFAGDFATVWILSAALLLVPSGATSVDPELPRNIRPHLLLAELARDPAVVSSSLAALTSGVFSRRGLLPLTQMVKSSPDICCDSSPRSTSRMLWLGVPLCEPHGPFVTLEPGMVTPESKLPDDVEPPLRKREKILRTRWSWFWSSFGSFFRLSASSLSLFISDTFRNINCKTSQGKNGERYGKVNGEELQK